MEMREIGKIKISGFVRRDEEDEGDWRFSVRYSILFF